MAKHDVIHLVFVSVELLHWLHRSLLIGTESAQCRLAPPLRSPLFAQWGVTLARDAQARSRAVTRLFTC